MPKPSRTSDVSRLPSPVLVNDASSSGTPDGTVPETPSDTGTRLYADLCHELRTSISAIDGLLRMTQDTGLSPNQSQFVTRALEQVTHLTHLINDSLELSRVGASNLSFAEVAYQPSNLATSCIDSFEIVARNKGLALTAHVDPDVPMWIEGDPTKTRQVLTNLIGNALKFTDDGEVSLTVSWHQSRDGTHHPEIIFEVSDTGIGFSQDQVERLFKPFEQAHAGIHDQYGGTGLGLAISRALVTRMGGTIEVRSQPNIGASFAVRLPGAIGSAPQFSHASIEPPILETTQPPLHVLVVDDHLINQEIVCAMLSKLGHTSFSAADGEAALLELDRGTCFDLILLDRMMPKMSGEEVLAHIRSSSRPYSAVPIIVLTAKALSGDRHLFMSGGANGYLVKPASMDQLQAAIAGALNLTR